MSNPMTVVTAERATALVEAQGDPHAESVAIRPVLRAWRKINYKPGRTAVQRFMGSVGFGSTECWYWLGYVDDLGYGISDVVDGERKAHRVSYRIFKGEIPAGKVVMHSCDVRACVNPDHLRVGTQAENVADMVAKGRQRMGDVSGENNGQAKLTHEHVAVIRQMKSEGTPQVEIARRFAVSPMTISRAVRGETWR